MNGHTFRYWYQENPSVKGAEWCGVTSSVIIQPHVLGEEELDTATVTAHSYRDKLENVMAADSRRFCPRNLWFNKVTTSHTSTVSIHILQNIFPGRFISRFEGFFGLAEFQT
jgi:hypothetical protein